ncbi:MAG: NADH-quinone oxidoreductase subunit L [Acidimicrobiia bacterium]
MEALIDFAEQWVWLIIALPLAGAVVNHFVGGRLPEPLPGLLATGASGLAFVVATVAAIPWIDGPQEAVRVELWSWMPSIGVEFAIRWDPLAIAMVLLVTGVGTLIHFFSIGYMHGDERFGRYFTWLNLFAASMLVLVMADNFGMVFLGWEMVGLCSYLLISFWYTKPVAAEAGKKAFVVNRIGDFGFILGLVAVFAFFGTMSFEGVLEAPGEVLSAGWATAIGVAFLIAAIGKSAQIPLYVWLPDAMAGPTPASALIHAATMVTAGVYLIARSASIFQLSEAALIAVALVGAVTALWAALIAVGQHDIKRVLAYSTVSQLGFMVIGVGSAAFTAGLFHLITHGVFKALLFLGAGSVIHAMGDEQDMRKMGGLLKKMPVTGWTMAIATLAIAGIPPLAGFWSKDEILGAAFDRGGVYQVIWVVGLLTSVITAFYMARWFVLVFLGQPRWDEGVEPHESPAVMSLPLVGLAGLTAVIGLINTPFALGFEHFLEPSFEGVALQVPAKGAILWILAGIATAGALVGLGVGFATYRDPARREAFETRASGFLAASGRAFGVDEAYSRWIVGPLATAAEAASRFDAGVIDGAVNGVARVVGRAGTALKPLQNGFARSYGVGIAAGALVLVLWFVSRGI